MEYNVNFEEVRKDLKKLPSHIVTKLLAWAKDVERYGLLEIKKIPGYHDEPLKGDRKGQRSIRLSKSYRAIYVEEYNKILIIVLVKEVNKHEY